MGAALQATAFPGCLVCCPGYRQHPAVVAQAAATLAEMFEGRFSLAVGTGQTLNEHITGEPWPAKDQRKARLRECVDVIRALWAGEIVTHHGLIHVEEARLYTLPQTPPRLIGAAVSCATAEWVGTWADAMVTTSRPPDDAWDMIEAFHRGGGEGKPAMSKAGISYAASHAEALANAHQEWRTVSFANNVLTELRMPAQFDEIGKHVRPEDLGLTIRISGDLAEHAAWIEQDVALGFTEVYLHKVGRNQGEFIDAFGAGVLPLFREGAGHGDRLV